MRLPLLALPLLLLAGCTGVPTGDGPGEARCNVLHAWGNPEPPALLPQPVQTPATDVGAWRVRYEPPTLRGDVGDVVRFRVVLEPNGTVAPTELSTGRWLRLVANTTMPVPATGAAFEAEMVVGAERQSLLRLGSQTFPGPTVAWTHGTEVPVEARTVRGGTGALPAGLCAGHDGGRLLASWSLGARTLDCGLRASPVGDAVLRNGTLFGFVFAGQGDVCSAGDPFTPRAAFATPPLAPGTYRVVFFVHDDPLGKTHHPLPGWARHEATVVLPAQTGDGAPASSP